jgi:hypothetical protein
MIRMIAIVVLGSALAFAAQAMPFTPIHQPDPMITQAAMGCGAGRVMVNGACLLGRTMPEGIVKCMLAALDDVVGRPSPRTLAVLRQR